VVAPLSAVRVVDDVVDDVDVDDVDDVDVDDVDVDDVDVDDVLLRLQLPYRRLAAKNR